MRILMLSWEYPPHIMGGLGTHIAGLAPALARAGVEVHLITLQSNDLSVSSRVSVEGNGRSREVTEDGVVVYRVPMACESHNVYDCARVTNQTMLARGHELLANGPSFDLIHAHDWLVVFAAQALKHQFRLPLIATIHATERGRVQGKTLCTELQRNIHDAEWRLTYEAWRVITCSHHMASEVQTYFCAPPGKIDVVPNGVDPYRNGHWTQADLADCRFRHVASDRRVVFAVGRLVYEKGFHLLIRAIPQVLAEFPNTQFIVAGRGPEAQNLMQQASKMGITDKVHFPGFVSNEERDYLYHIAACAVFPSLYEPFGIVALEAMAAGCPVVVAEVGGLGEVVRHGKTGVTVYPDDAQSVAWGISNTLCAPALAAARAEEARRVIQCEFNWDAIAARTISAYQQVLDERRRIDW